jgi:xylulokinase
MLLLGIDIGTASAKGVLARPDGTVVAQATREHRVSAPHPGWVEHDPAGVWWDGFVALAGELAGAAASVGEPIAAVGVSGIGPCLLPTSADGQPLRAAILYGVDTRATAEIAAQASRYGAEEVLARCGSPLTSQAVGPKLAWVRGHEPEVWAASRRWYMASSWLVYQLTGEYVLDHHSASQCTPLYDPGAQGWIGEWCEEIAPGLEWPRLLWPADIAGTVTAHAAEATGLPAGIPVVTGTIDAWAESISVGVAVPGDVMVMYGTTMFLVEVLAGRRSWPTLWGTVGAFPGTYNLAAGMATSGAITAWLKELTGAGYPTLLAEATTAGVGADGLLMLPYFAGERTPLFDPDARGVIVGLTLRHGRGHLYRAALEATAFGVRHNLEAMAEAGGAAKRLVAVGGGTQGGLWTQIVSDVTGQPQQLPRHTIGAAYGDALLAGLGADLVPEPGTWNPIETTVTPDPAATEQYDTLYRLYRDLYPATLPIAHTLATRQLG